MDSLTYIQNQRIPVGLLGSENAPAESFAREWFDGELAALAEPRLAAVIDDGIEAYRFLWLRSFDPPIAVRLQWERGHVTAVVSQTEHSAYFEKAKLTVKDTFSLSDAEWDQLQATLEREQFWRLMRSDPRRPGLDGAQWIVEGVREHRYHIVQRWTPPDTGAAGAVRRVGLLFLRVGRVTVASGRVY